jgi:hypothetical protein
VLVARGEDFQASCEPTGLLGRDAAWSPLTQNAFMLA